VNLDFKEKLATFGELLNILRSVADTARKPIYVLKRKLEPWWRPLLWANRFAIGDMN
jgi:hypothetical protein